MKDKQEVINKFNEQVNMSASELRIWLDSPESRKAGTGVGIESGNKIVDILTRNPNKDPSDYTDVGKFSGHNASVSCGAVGGRRAHETRRLVSNIMFRGIESQITDPHYLSYNSRHLAQEDHLKETKTPDELEKTKSTIRLLGSFFDA
jgi:hypothetical protein